MKLQKVTRFVMLATVLVMDLFIPFAGAVRADNLIPGQAPAIKFTKVPTSGGGPDRLQTIAGVVSGVNVKECECRIVLYSLTDQYWVQPFAENPYTELSSEASFEADIHLGQRYFALLVKKSFRAAARLAQLPEVGGEVMLIASVKGREEN